MDTILPPWLMFVALLYHSSNDIARILGIEYSAAKKLRNRINEYTVASVDNLMKSRRTLEKSSLSQLVFDATKQK